MRSLSVLFVFLFIVGVVGSAVERRPRYRPPIPHAPTSTVADDDDKPLLWEGPDGKLHVLDRKAVANALGRGSSDGRTRSVRAPIGSDVSFEPGKPMVDVSTPSSGSRYR